MGDRRPDRAGAPDARQRRERTEKGTDAQVEIEPAVRPLILAVWHKGKRANDGAKQLAPTAGDWLACYASDVPTGWIAIFRGGFELELGTDLVRPVVRLFSRTGEPLGLERWGAAQKPTGGTERHKF